MVNFVIAKERSARRPVKTNPKCSATKDSKEMLKQEMRTHFAVDARRIDLLARLLIAILQVCTVSYAQLALALNAKVKISSNVKRLQRFFKEFSFSHRAYIQFVWRQFASQKTVLTIDRTDWKFGRHHINVLMIGIAYRGTAIPLIWKLLGKAGNSSQRERIGLMPPWRGGGCCSLLLMSKSLVLRLLQPIGSLLDIVG